MSKYQARLVDWKGYERELNNIVDYCKVTKQDWPFCFGGDEGSGKSTLAIQSAKVLDPDFDVETQIVDNLLEYIKLTKKMKNNPYKVILMDEAVKLFFSREFGNKANIILVKLFISNRSFRQFNLLTIPNVFYLDKYIREWRLKTLNYSWIDNINFDKRYFAYYSRKRYKSILADPSKGRIAMLDRELLMNKYKPNFYSPFGMLDKKTWEKYSAIKKQNQLNLLDDALNEAIKLEDAKKIGFTKSMPVPQFLRWLVSHFGVENHRGETYFNVTHEMAAKEAITAKKTMNFLINRLLDYNLLTEIGVSQYRLTSKGAELLKPPKADDLSDK